jgi:AcrR family transcriptional regulator
MSSAKKQSRHEKSTDVFLRAGVKAVAESGIDRISVSQVTDIAEATRPTFYSYFGDIHGLLAEIWIGYSEQWLEELTDVDFSIDKQDKFKKELWLTLAEILAVTHRVPALQEVVQPTFDAWQKIQSSRSMLQQLKTYWLISTRLGMLITQGSDKKVALAKIIDPLVKFTPDAPSVKLSELGPAVLPPVSDPKIPELSIENQLIQAAIEVIASAGAAAASMTRISRKARLSTGSAYPRFANSSDLINSSFEMAVSRVVEQNFSFIDLDGFGPEDFGLFVQAGLTPPRKTWRNFRIEIHLEGRINKELGKRLAKSLQMTNAQVAKGLVKYGHPEITEEAIPYFMHAVGIGFAILLNVGLPVEKLDQRIATVEFVKLFDKMAEYAK